MISVKVSFKDSLIHFNPHAQSIRKTDTPVDKLAKALVNFHRDAVRAEVLVDKLKLGFASVLVLLFETGVVVDLAYSPEELS